MKTPTLAIHLTAAADRGAFKVMISYSLPLPPSHTCYHGVHVTNPCFVGQPPDRFPADLGHADRARAVSESLFCVSRPDPTNASMRPPQHADVKNVAPLPSVLQHEASLGRERRRRIAALPG